MTKKTICRKELLETAEKYIDDYNDYGDAMPSIAGISLVLGISRQVMYNWRDENHATYNEKWAEIHDRLLTKQENVLLNNGLTNVFNPAITKLALGKHGYKERVEESSDPDAPKELNIKILHE